MGQLHPQVQAVVEAMASAGIRSFSELTVAEARRDVAAANANFPPERHPSIAAIRDATISGQDGALRVREYIPEGTMVARMVFYHGGGWVLGELGDTDGLCQAIAVEMRCEVVSVAYRLAPEAPFPAAVNDAYAALMWSASLEDRQPLVVAGESSGGNLAAVTALRAREENGPELAAQVLIYPVTNHDFETPSYQRYGRSAPVLTRADMEWFWDHYVPDRDLRHDPFASPLRSPDLTGLPPAVVVLAGVDPVHDDGASFATRLLADGVPTSVLEYPDMPHGFFSMLGMLDDASRAHEEVCSALWHHLGVA